MDFFKLRENKTTVSKELNAGFTTFLTMIYIVPVNSIIMSKAGMPIDALITATTLITAIATIINGLWANTPMAMSVGMGLNAYFTFGLCLSMKVPWQTALGVVFLSGVIFVILSFTNFRVWVLKSIPADLCRAISGGIGVFIAFVGLQQMGIVVKNDTVLLGLGNVSDPHVLISLVGIFIIIGLWVRKINGAFVIGVLLTTLLCWIFGLAPLPTEFLSQPASINPIFLQLDIKSVFFDEKGLFTLALVPVIIVFFVTDLFDSIGTLSGVASRSGVDMQNSKEDVKKLEKTLEADALATVTGSLLGVSTTTTFVESSSGVEAGGRTGLTAIFCGIFFLCILFMLPLFKAIPANAIYPVLVVVGVLMFTELGSIDYKDPAISVATFFMVTLVPLTYSITNGLAFGFLAYLVVRIFRNEWDKINVGIVTLSIISFVVFVVH
ncbi:NCS2 family permease [Campylobacter mucosalis]|uniref:NCS2 family permease n=1 Tax=Campylobacter mucosalis TaxID=202 RepID=UPI0014708084|nr:NCS2 family permease [Campylobacter mucosalis]QKF62778.1 xanthine/uracil/vitamin C permease [Campylobacter mucosalis]